MCTLFFNNKHYSTPRSVVGWLQRWETADTEELHIQRATHKLYADFCCAESQCPNSHVVQGSAEYSVVARQHLDQEI